MCCAPAAVGEGEPENRLLKKSLAFGDEVWVITFMDEDVTDQTAGAPQSGPAAAAGGGATDRDSSHAGIGW